MSNVTFSHNRIPAFDLLKVFAIYMVLWGHCIQYLIFSEHSQDSLYRIIYSFHMPLFMMIAGYFSINSYHLSFLVFFKKKFWQLIYPVFIWGIVFFLTNSIVKLSHGDSIFPIYDLIAIFTKNLWFLKSVFVCYILGFVCFRNKIHLTMLIITLIASQFIATHNICIMYPVFVCGIILNYTPSILKNQYIMLSLSIIYLIMLIWWDDSFWPPKSAWFAPDMMQTIITGDESYVYQYLQKGLYRIGIGVTSSIAFIILFNLLFNNYIGRIATYLSIWGQYTLRIYIFQFYILECILWKYINFDHINSFIFHFIISPTISIFLLILLARLAIFTNNNKTLSTILWGK